MPDQKIIKTYCKKCCDAFYYIAGIESDEWCPKCLYDYLMRLEIKYEDLKFELETMTDLLGDSEDENAILADKIKALELEIEHGKQEN